MLMLRFFCNNNNNLPRLVLPHHPVDQLLPPILLIDNIININNCIVHLQVVPWIISIPPKTIMLEEEQGEWIEIVLPHVKLLPVLPVKNTIYLLVYYHLPIDIVEGVRLGD